MESAIYLKLSELVLPINDDSIKPVGRTGAVRLHRFKKRILTRSSDGAKQKHAQVGVVAHVDDHGGGEADADGQKDAGRVLQTRHVAIQHSQ